MKIATLTFQFAHNYGAMLQAYALKQYMETLGHEVDVAPFYPDWAQKEYTISPFAKGISIRKRIRFFLQYSARHKLARKFDAFQQDYLKLERSFETLDDLNSYLNGYDVVVCGSDQIWNDKITGETPAYYGADTTAGRYAYAASLGTKKLTEFQRSCIRKYMSKFKGVSVRETNSEQIIKDLVSSSVQTVVDPVFLLPQNQWAQIAQNPGVGKPFMFLYFLRDDEGLLDSARQYASKNGLTIYEVHPTLARFHNGCKPLINVGPLEFLWLIQNAECVCTNSFHATSFSVIFRKNLLHIPNSASPARTVSLLSFLGIDTEDVDKKLPLYNLADYDYTNLNVKIDESKQFLERIGQ